MSYIFKMQGRDMILGYIFLHGGRALNLMLPYFCFCCVVVVVVV